METLTITYKLDDYPEISTSVKGENLRLDYHMVHFFKIALQTAWSNEQVERFFNGSDS